MNEEAIKKQNLERVRLGELLEQMPRVGNPYAIYLPIARRDPNVTRQQEGAISFKAATFEEATQAQREADVEILFKLQLMAETLRKLLVAAKVIRSEAEPTGPELIMVAEEFGELLAKGELVRLPSEEE